MSARTEEAFAALVGLDPLHRGAATPNATLDGATSEADLARIIATPRSGVISAGAGRSPRWSGAPGRRRIRYGAVGLVASAALAVTTTLVWASPSAGSPPDQAVSAPAQISPAHAVPPT